MPRLLSSVPKYRCHRASGQGVVTIAGRTHYLGPHGTVASRHEYDRLVTEWLARGRPIGEPRIRSLTVTELVASYFRFVRDYYVKEGGPTSEQSAIRCAMRPVLRLYGRHPACEFRALALQAVRAKYIEAGLSRYTANKNTARVRRMFRWAVAQELIPSDVFHSLSAVPGLRRGQTEARETKPVMPIGDSEVQSTLPHLSAVVADMVLFQRLTGCRPAEVCIIRPCDAERSGDVWVYRPESHKTEHHGKERAIFIGPKAAAILRPYLLRPTDAFCFSPQDAERQRRAERTEARKTPTSCGNSVGANRKRKPKRAARERYDTASYRRAIHRACDKAEIARWSPNRLRHSAATDIRSKYGLEATQVILGHATADVTQVYAERDYKLAARVAMEVG